MTSVARGAGLGWVGAIASLMAQEALRKESKIKQPINPHNIVKKTELLILPVKIRMNTIMKNSIKIFKKLKIDLPCESAFQTQPWGIKPASKPPPPHVLVYVYDGATHSG